MTCSYSDVCKFKVVAVPHGMCPVSAVHNFISAKSYVVTFDTANAVGASVCFFTIFIEELNLFNALSRFPIDSYYTDVSVKVEG
jgi:hypothetical protein